MSVDISPAAKLRNVSLILRNVSLILRNVSLISHRDRRGRVRNPETDVRSVRVQVPVQLFLPDVAVDVETVHLSPPSREYGQTQSNGKLFLVNNKMFVWRNNYSPLRSRRSWCRRGGARGPSSEETPRARSRSRARCCRCIRSATPPDINHQPAVQNQTYGDCCTSAGISQRNTPRH